MKKLAIRGLALVLVLVMCIGLLPALSAFAATSDDLLGTWQGALSRTIVLKADGTGTFTDSAQVTTALTWSYDGTTLTMTPASGKIVQTSFDGTNLKAKIQINGAGYSYAPVTFTKIAGPEPEAPAAEWIKVTEAPADWSGKYLIVYEEGGLAMNGALGADLDSASNGVAVTIADGKIADSADLAAITVTIAPMEGGYSLQLADGSYFGNGTTSNKLYVDSAPYANTIALSDDDGVLITGVGGTVLRYNANSDQERFRFFKSNTYTSQKPIALYKLAEPATEEPEPEVETVTVHAQVPASWTSVALYAWRADNSNNGAWPGVEMTLEGDWYTAEMPNDMPNVIINNNVKDGAIQTADIAVEAGKDLWIVVNDDNSYNLYYSEDEVPVPPQEPDAALVALLNGKYHLTFPMMSPDPQSIVEFIPDEGGATGVLNILAQKGQEVFISYTYSVSGTTVTVNYGEDDPVYVIMNNKGGLSYQDNSLNKAFELAKYEEAPPVVEDPVLNLGDNAITVTDAWNGTTVSFTASAAGTYILSAAEGEGNAFIMIESNTGAENIDLPYTFTLEADESISFIILTDDEQADTIDLVISEKEEELPPVEPQDNVLVLGDNAINVTVENYWSNYEIYTFTSVNGGTFILKPAADELNADVYKDSDAWGEWINFAELPNGYEFTLNAGETITFAIGTSFVMSDSDEINLILEEKQDSGEEPADNTLVLGDNTINVTVENYWSNYEIYTFTSVNGGTFILKPAADELNADVYKDSDAWGEWINFAELPNGYEFTLNAGETITFAIGTSFVMSDSDEINLILEEKQNSGEGGGDEDPEPQDNVLVLGENEVAVQEGYNGGDVYTFTAEEAGQYTITEIGGGLMVSAPANTISGYDTVDLPYTFTLEAGQTITLKIGTVTWSNSTVFFELNKATGEGGEGGGDPILPEFDGFVIGENAVPVDGESGSEYTFTAPKTGTYSFSYAAGEANGDCFGMTANYDSMPIPGEIRLEAGQTLTIYCYTMNSTSDVIDMVIEFTPAGPSETGDNTMVFVLMAAVSVMAMGAVLVIGKKKAI